jgi:hypothetical protein
LGPRNLTDEGITMHINPLKENASSWISLNFEIDSKMTDKSDSQREKQHRSSVSTDDGITRLVNPLGENASFPIRFNFEIDANLTDNSDSQ